ncbi:MAG: HAMP domain-containing histidine kinase, partial [Oscillospiraceae bacterium]|nr:HAMP domain-containing histidine kinase [Oscillospiraceae bacterium]
MKSVPRLIRRFAGIMLLCFVLLAAVNFAGLLALVLSQSPNEADSPYNIAAEAGGALHRTDSGWALTEEMSAKIAASGAWAIFIDDSSLRAVWRSDNTPDAVPSDYTLADIADLTFGYLDGCPTYTGESEGGIVVLGFPRDSFWKHTRASWSYDFIANLPQTVFAALLVNLAVIILIYIIANAKLLKSVEPITKGIQDLAAGECVRVAETGLLCEISANLNRASDILREQREQLKKKETARVNWRAGVSHDIRTPLTTVMGCAAQLEASDNLTPSERKKAAAIVRQSGRMRNLIDDLNLASKLEYDMQPLAKKQVNAVAVMRQVAADFMNAAADERHPIVWQTNPVLRSCIVEADADLLSRAAANIVQNSIVHN